MVDRAQKQPVTEENVRKQLGKMGDSAFVPAHMEVQVGEDAFYPLRQMNELRREAVSRLEQSILERNGYSGLNHPCDREFQVKRETQMRERLPLQTGGEFQAGEFQVKDKYSRERSQEPEITGIAVSVRTLEQLQGVAGCLKEPAGKNFKRLYIDGDLLMERTQETVALCEKLHDTAEFFIALPYILRQEDDIYLESVSEIMHNYPVFRGMLVRSLDELAYVKKKGYHNRLDANVYCWNSMTLEELRNMTSGFCLPLELKAGEQRKLLEMSSRISECGKFEKLVYGRIPMMVTANCLLKTTGNCQPGNYGSVVLTDRYGKAFPVLGICRHCMNIIYNSVPLSLHQNQGEWYGRTDVRLDFTIETGGETMRILEAFLGKGTLPYEEYTTGHEKRGVE